MKIGLMTVYYPNYGSLIYAHITKPIDIDVLFDTLDKMMR